MKKFKLLTLFLILVSGTQALSAKVWLNDLRTLYSNKNAIIYEINIRTFNANDKDGNGIITRGEERGNFINASKRISELSEAGINTVKLLPILPVSKKHALGTAGSLFAPADFDKIDPFLKSPNGISVIEETKKFINECHKKNIRVIVDLPCCAGYDLYLKNPNLFLKDETGKPISPVDNDDVFILNSQQGVYNLYKRFTQLMLDLSVDGISVCMPETKPFDFWKKLINETRKRDSQMLFIAEINPDSKNIFKNSVDILSTTKLLEAGFDGYSGSYNRLNNPKENLYSLFKSDIAVSEKFDNKIAAYANFSSYDVETPIIKKGPEYVKQLIWFAATSPLNIYYIDGFSTGDNYMYSLSNKKAKSTFTDDKYYFMKRGQIDIYNFSRKPGGFNYDIYSEFILANKFKIIVADVLAKGNLVTLKTNNSNVLAYSRSYNNSTVIIVANAENLELEKIKIKVPKLNNEVFAIPIKVSANIPNLSRGEILTNLAPFETQILLLQNFSIK